MTTYASDGTTQTSTEQLDVDQAPRDDDITRDSTDDELEIVDADTLPAVRRADVEASSATPAKWVHPEGWSHDWLEFKGDQLAVRIPNGAALVALEFSRYRGDEAQEQAFGRFIARHVSDATFDRVLDRMSDPDDTDYAATGILGELAGLLGKIAGERLAKDAKALEEAKNGQARKGNR